MAASLILTRQQQRGKKTTQSNYYVINIGKQVALPFLPNSVMAVATVWKLRIAPPPPLRSRFGTEEAMEQPNGEGSMPVLEQDGHIHKHN